MLVSLTFRDGASYTFKEEYEEDLVPGSWDYPFPNEPENCQAEGLLEAWYQGEGPIPYMARHHGEVVQVKIFEPVADEGIYKFMWDMGRVGSISGTFVATAKEIDDLVDEYLDFDNALGKHSEVNGIFKREEATLLTDDPIQVEHFKSNSMSVGYNPLKHVYREDEDY
jgi:hypothetical protein